jgi:hypothetical protein
MEWTTAVVAAAADYRWPTVLLLLAVGALRSGPVRALGDVATTDIKVRYLRRRGVPEDEWRAFIVREIAPEEPEPPPDKTDDQSEPSG